MPPAPIPNNAKGDLHNQITGIIFDYVRLGSVSTLKQEQERLGFAQPEQISYLVDEKSYNQNALFVSAVIKDEKKAYEMTKYLIEEARCQAFLQDTNNQTCLFYVARDGRVDLAKLFLQHGCKANHTDSYG